MIEIIFLRIVLGTITTGVLAFAIWQRFKRKMFKTDWFQINKRLETTEIRYYRTYKVELSDREKERMRNLVCEAYKRGGIDEANSILNVWERYAFDLYRPPR